MIPNRSGTPEEDIAAALAGIRDGTGAPMSSETKTEIADAIAVLPEREKLVIALYYYENLALREIGEVLGVTESRISQIHRSALRSIAGRLGLFDSDGRPRPALIAPDGQPLAEASRESREVQLRVQNISSELIATLARHPEGVYELNPRRFEELVAELYARRGFEVVLTPASNDGGADLLVAKHDVLGRSLHVVQCKRYAPGRKIGPAVVRELIGTVEHRRASTGVLLTTSFFTKGARRLEQDYEHRLTLHDFVALRDLLNLPPV
ncbi:sigma-70 family RNA polymerase sigma factor [Baekduia sp. Peel2402]|uniref:sigma-70 family RNA polymerase sigma factor n=1 Tax=Baekduia sp. Peel2402 TaxID=3458296 RepID=UPI00403EE76C